MNSENEIDIEKEIDHNIQKNNNSFNYMSYITYIYNFIMSYKFYFIGLIVLIIIYFFYYKKMTKSKLNISPKDIVIEPINNVSEKIKEKKENNNEQEYHIEQENHNENDIIKENTELNLEDSENNENNLNKFNLTNSEIENIENNLNN